MSTINWAADADGDFANKANWTGGKAPGAGDTADLFTAGYAYFTVTSAANEAVGSLFVSNYATLDLTAGIFGVANTVTVEGAVDGVAGWLPPSPADGVISNQGEIDLSSVTSGKNSLLEITGSAVSLTGIGVISLAKYGGIKGAFDSDTLYNVSTISGGGYVGGLAVVNRAGGVFDGTADMKIDTTGQILDNSGLIEATGGGFGLGIGYTTVLNQGGTIAGNGGTLGLISTVVEGGTLATSAGGLIESGGNGVVLDGVASALTNTGAFQFQGTLGMEGLDHQHRGDLPENTAAAAGIQLEQNLTIAGAGTVAFDGSGLNMICSSSGNDFALTNDGTISGTVEIGNVALTNMASGVIEAHGAGQSIRVESGTHINAGLMKADSGTNFYVSGGVMNNARRDDPRQRGRDSRSSWRARGGRRRGVHRCDGNVICRRNEHDRPLRRRGRDQRRPDVLRRQRLSVQGRHNSQRRRRAERGRRVGRHPGGRHASGRRGAPRHFGNRQPLDDRHRQRLLRADPGRERQQRDHRPGRRRGLHRPAYPLRRGGAFRRRHGAYERRQGANLRRFGVQHPDQRQQHHRWRGRHRGQSHDPGQPGRRERSRLQACSPSATRREGI